MSRRTVAVVGGGPIGLAVAWRCAARSLPVTVYEPTLPAVAATPVAVGPGNGTRPPARPGFQRPAAGAAPAVGSGAWSVAAGMLSPVAEAYFGEERLTALLVESAARWPGFAAELTAATGLDLGYRTEGTLVVALTADDLAEVDRLRAYQSGLGLPIDGLRPGQLRDREPALTPRLRGGAHAPADHQVDPRRLVAALRAALDAAGVPVLPAAVRDLSQVDADVTVVAAGCGTAALTGLPIRPVKGQILRLRAHGGAQPGFRHVIRGYADSRQVYLVPRRDGEVVVGATIEERTDAAVTAGGVLDLLRAATDLVPELSAYDLVQAGVGHRPATPDNAPVLGGLPGRPGVVVAAGHYRHGVVLTPVTADLIADLVTGAAPDPLLEPFAPARFAPTTRPAAPATRPAPIGRFDPTTRPGPAGGSVPGDGAGPTAGTGTAGPSVPTQEVPCR